MKNLVTGASGFVGTNLVRRLVERGEKVRVLVRRTSDTSGFAGLPVERFYGDIRDPAAVWDAVRGCDRVYHTAATVDARLGVGRRLKEVNVAGPIHVAAACRRAGVDRLVFTSSIAAIGHGTPARPATEETTYNLGFLGIPYLDTKKEAEDRLLEYHRAGLSLVIVNPAYIIGAWDRTPNSGLYVVLAARGMLRLSFPGGINIVDVDDVAEGHIRAMESGRSGERYILGGENLSYDDFLGVLASVVHRRPPLMRMPGGLSAMIGAAGDFMGAVFGWQTHVNRTTMRYIRLCHYVSSAKAERDLGMKFGSARQALEKAYIWFREHGYIR